LFGFILFKIWKREILEVVAILDPHDDEDVENAVTSRFAALPSEGVGSCVTPERLTTSAKVTNAILQDELDLGHEGGQLDAAPVVLFVRAQRCHAWIIAVDDSQLLHVVLGILMVEEAQSILPHKKK